MRYPLRYQILLPLAALLLAAVVSVSLLGSYLAARRTQRQIEAQLHNVAQTLRESHFPLTDAVLRQTRGLSGAEFILADPRGKLLAVSSEFADLSAVPTTAPIKPGAFSLDDSVRMSGQDYFHASVSLAPRAAAPAGTVLHILYPRQQLSEARWQAAYPPLVVGGVVLVLAAAVAIAIAGRLSRPILELQRQLSRLVHGDFQPLAMPPHNDELRDLVGSVNELGDQLDELRRVIKRSERLAILGQLSGGLAHQLRNAVTGARIAVQLHGRHCKQLDQDSLSVALRQLTVTEAHLQRFLSAGQPAAPVFAACDLGQVIADVAALVSAACHHRGMKLQMPDAEQSGCPLWADAEQLRQLLLNLVLNALEAAGTSGWVRVELDRAPHSVTLRVLDSGPGPGENMMARLFEPFATGKPEGIGLGLAVARQIVTAHGGTIACLRREATCFEVMLPVKPIPAGDPPGVERDEPAAMHAAAR